MTSHNPTDHGKEKVAAILKLLDRSTTQLDRRVADRLHHARTEALKRHHVYEEAHAFASPGLTNRWYGGISHLSKRQMLLAALVIAVVTAFSCTALWSHTDDHSDIDIAILTDELPIEIFVD